MGGKGGVEQRMENNARWAVSSPATKKEEVYETWKEKGQMVSRTSALQHFECT